MTESVSNASRSSTEAHVVKVAVMFGVKTTLTVLDLRLPLSDIITNLVAVFDNRQIQPQKCILMVVPKGEDKVTDRDKGTNYVYNKKNIFLDETNKYEVKDGDFLKLETAPSEEIKRLQYCLKTSQRDEALSTLVYYSQDNFILRELFNNEEALSAVSDIASCQSDNIGISVNINAFTIISRLLELGYDVPLTDNFIKKVLLFLSKKNKEVNVSLLLISFKILQQIVLKRKLVGHTTKSKVNIINDLYPHMWNRNNPELQASAFRACNLIVLSYDSSQESAKLRREVISQSVKRCIQENILRPDASREIIHELYVYQVILLNEHYDKWAKKIDHENEEYKALRRISVRYDTNELQGFDSTNMASKTIPSAAEVDLLKRKNSGLLNLLDTFGNSTKKISGTIGGVLSRQPSKRNKSLSRLQSVGAESMSEAREEQHSTNQKNLRRSSSFKEAQTRQSLSDEFKKDNRDSETSINYISNLNFEFDNKLNHKTMASLYDTPKASNKIKKQFQPGQAAHLSKKPPIAKKPQNIDTKVKLSKERRKQNWKPSFGVGPSSPDDESSWRSSYYILAESKTTPISLLAFNNIKYLANHNKQSFKKNCIMDKRCGMSFFLLGHQITDLICDLLEVGQSPKETGVFYPVILKIDYFMEEMFCETVTLFRRTWTEMKGSVLSDYNKVLSVVKMQLKKALADRPVSIEQMNTTLEAIRYETIAEIRKLELETKIKSDLNNKKPFVELRKVIEIRMLKLLERYIIKFMTEGITFSKYTMKGQKVKDANANLCLSKNRKIITYTEISGSSKSEQKIINVSDIIDVETGVESKASRDLINHAQSERDMFFRPTLPLQLKHMTENMFSIITNEFSIDVPADNVASMNFWADGIRLLKGQPMITPSVEEEVKKMADLELRLHVLELEGIEVPDDPPPVPPPPSNYDFCVKSTAI